MAAETAANLIFAVLEDIEGSFVNFGSEAGGSKDYGNYSLVKFEVLGSAATS